MSVTYDLMLRGGTVIDPARDFHGPADVLIHDGLIALAPPGQPAAAEKVLDATGCLVLPGLIDFHTHLYFGGTAIGIQPDSALLPQGVTTAVDQGSTGVNNFESFYKTVIQTSQVRIFAHLHSSPAGLATLRRSQEVADPAVFDPAAAARLFRQFGDRLVGLKIRQSREIVGDYGLAPLAATVRMAEEIGCRVAVHTTNPPEEVGQLAALLRSGDIYTHMYQGKGHHIIGDGGKVRQSIRAARERGVIFDTADGRPHYTFAVIRAAIADGFPPDIISTDLVTGGLYDRSLFGLPQVMAKYLALGLPLTEVVRACTQTPAALLGMAGTIGTLAPGACADVAVFRLKEAALPLTDSTGEVLTCRQLPVPQLTIRGGQVVYRNIEW